MKTPNERRRTRRRAQANLDVLLTIAIIVTMGFVVWVNWPPPPPPPVPLPPEPVALDGVSTKGSPAARVVLIEHSDFECQFCGAFARETLPAIDREYVQSGRIRIAYRHITPPGHRRARPAAIAAECAGRQGKFWEMHDRLFADQTKLSDTDLAAHGEALGLDPRAFAACQADPTSADRIARDMADARPLRIPGTPAFFIGTVEPDGRVRVNRSLRGAVPVGEMRNALDAELGDGSLTGTLAGVGAVGVGLTAFGLWARRRRRPAPVVVG